jgi:hypothetical protein
MRNYECDMVLPVWQDEMVFGMGRPFILGWSELGQSPPIIGG